MAKPLGNHELAFRLLGLKWSSASARVIGNARRKLLASQNDDGGWSQLPKLRSDAYATGLALYALHIGGDLQTNAESYQRGIAFLLSRQKADGSWHVKSRAYRLQTYFESGFPHEHDQWISAAGTGWAAMALMFGGK